MSSKLLIISLAVLLSISCNDCNGEDRVIDDIVSLELHFQVCRDTSYFETRGLTLSRWAGNLRTPSAGAEGGDTSFEVIPTVAQSPVAESPDGRSWFVLGTRAENLRPGEWDITVEYIMSGAGRSLDDQVEVLAAGSSVYFTAGIDEASLANFPPCP